MKVWEDDISTVEEYDERYIHRSKYFRVYNLEDALLVNKIIDKFGIVPHVEVCSDVGGILDILYPDIIISLYNDDFKNPILVKFKKIMLNEEIPLATLLNVNKDLLGKIHPVEYDVTKSGQIAKLGYIPGVYINICKDFEFDMDLIGISIYFIHLAYADDCVVERIFNQVEKIKFIQMNPKHVKFIKPHMNFVDINMGYGDDIDFNLVVDIQDLANNPNIKSITSSSKVSGDFSGNFTLTNFSMWTDKFGDYSCCSVPHIREIVNRNIRFAEEARFKKVKPV